MREARKIHGNILPPLVLFLLPWVLYFPAWLKPMAKSDNLVELFQWARFDFESLRHGIDPLWNPYTCSGFPLIGYANTSIYSILSLPHLILPQVFALTIQIMLLHGFAALGVYLFTRKLGASEDGAFIAGATYSFSGFILQGIQYSYFTAGAAWIGFVFLALENIRTATSRKKLIIWTLIASILLAVQILAGHPQLAIMSGLLYGIYFIWYAVPGTWAHRLKIFGAGIAIVVGAVGMTAAIWMPAAELVRYSYRENISFDRFVILSVPPLKLYSNIFLLRIGEYFEYSFWVGVPVVLLIWLAVRRKRQESMVKFLVLCLAVSLIMGLGQYTPLFKLLFHVPVINKLTAPVRWAVDFCFAASCLAAIGWDSMGSSDLNRCLDRLDLMALAVLTLIALGLASFDGGLAVLNSMPSLLMGIAAILFMSGKLLSRLRGGRSAALFLSLIIFPGWLAWGGPWFKGADPRPEWAPHWRAVEETIAGDPKARIMDFVDLRGVSTDIIRRLPAHNLNIPNKWSYAVGYQPLMSGRYTELMNSDFVGIIGQISNLLDEKNRALDILNVKALLIPSDYLKMPESYFRNVQDHGNFQGVDFGENLSITLNPAQTMGFKTPEMMGAVNGVAIISALGNSAQIPQGKDVAEIALADGNGESRVLKVRAGIETAETMYPPRVDRHEVSLRVEGIPFFEETNFPVWGGANHDFSFRSTTVSHIALLTYLFNAENARQGEPVAVARVIPENDATREFVLRAGVDTALWTTGTVAAGARKNSAKVGQVFNANGVEGHSFFTVLNFNPPVQASTINIKCLLKGEGTGIYISNITIADSSGGYDPVEANGIAHDMPQAALGETGQARLYMARWEFPPITLRRIDIKSLLDNLHKTVFSVNKITFIKKDAFWPVHPVDMAIGNAERFEIAHEDDLATLIVNKNSLPRAWIAEQTQLLRPNDILKTIKTSVLPNNMPFDPLKTALIEQEMAYSTDYPILDGPREPSVRFEEYSANRISLSAAVPRRSMLVIGEIYYPGWVTLIDGKPVPTYQVDYVLRGVALQPGWHKIEQVFKPASVRLGRIISVFSSLLAIGMLGILILSDAISRRRAGKENDTSSRMRDSS